MINRGDNFVDKHRNVNALLGWFGLIVGVLGVLLQLWMGLPVIWLSVFGAIGGAIILSFSGPTRTVTITKEDLSPAAIDHSHETE